MPFNSGAKEKHLKEWIRDNIGKVITATALIFTVIGFLAGLWKEQVSLVKEIEKLQIKVDDARDDVKDLKTIIQNRVLTRTGE